MGRTGEWFVEVWIEKPRRARAHRVPKRTRIILNGSEGAVELIGAGREFAERVCSLLNGGLPPKQTTTDPGPKD